MVIVILHSSNLQICIGAWGLRPHSCDQTLDSSPMSGYFDSVIADSNDMIGGRPPMGELSNNTIIQRIIPTSNPIVVPPVCYFYIFSLGHGAYAPLWVLALGIYADAKNQ